MTPLRQAFIRELVLRGTAPRTQDAYIRAVYCLAKHFHRAPDQLGDEELKSYLFYLASERKLSASSLNQIVSGLRYFYATVLHRSVDELRFALPRASQPTKRPQVFSGEELERLFTVGCPHVKHRTFLVTVYGAGLRLNEACHLKPEHIDRARMQIRVVQGKGSKDRYTLLAPKLLEELDHYGRYFRSVCWVFPGTANPELPMNDRTGQKIFYSAIQRAGLRNKGGIHSLRHSFATHLLETGVEITIVQRLLGHSSLSTTSNYLHVRQERVAQIQSPLQLLDWSRIPGRAKKG